MKIIFQNTSVEDNQINAFVVHYELIHEIEESPTYEKKIKMKIPTEKFKSFH